MKSIDLRIHNLQQYLLDKFHERDYHAVSDAANDLRVLLAIQETMRANGILEPLEKDEEVFSISPVEDY